MSNACVIGAIIVGKAIIGKRVWPMGEGQTDRQTGALMDRQKDTVRQTVTG